jgi:NAD(P)-dependent dehydrogenase (short-subunit alcohol dehydrogenase family)
MLSCLIPHELYLRSITTLETSPTMVSLPEIRASNAQINEDNLPRLAVFIGSTAGIGKAALTALVSQKTSLKIYILGRNETSHREFLRHLQQSNSQAEIVWLEGQVTLLAEVKRLCIEIKSREESIDLLFLSAGFLPFTGRQGIYYLTSFRVRDSLPFHRNF